MSAPITLLQGKRIVLGVTGSIAAYKSADLASRLTQAGAAVDVILTEAAARFISPLTFRSVTGRDVYTDMWDLADHVRHVQLGETADLLVIAPATAHTLAKLAHGLADNLLTVTALAARCPLLLAPAMDGGMFEHPATQANLATLGERGAILAGPAEGRMASGLTGRGRLLEPADLLAHIRLALARGGPLAGRQVTVTAGPTREPLDPVRYLGNRSSGRQGIALAQAALDAGGLVTLIAGPLAEPVPIGLRHRPVRTAEEMCAAVLEEMAACDLLLMAAAVADFRPAEVASHKLKKDRQDEAGMAVRLERTPDILAAVKERRATTGRPLIALGFAAETERPLEHGREKLIRKGLDFIAVNDVGAADAGFEVDTNRITLLSAGGEPLELPLQSKTAVAERLIEIVAAALVERPA